MRKIVITGAAGLVGQNLVARLKARNDLALVGIDKHPTNVRLFREIHPGIPIIEANLAEAGPWFDCFSGADAVVINPRSSTDATFAALIREIRSRLNADRGYRQIS